MHWNRCDECGRFIPLRDFETGAARRVLVCPDSDFTEETYETLCRDHKPTPAQAYINAAQPVNPKV